MLPEDHRVGNEIYAFWRTKNTQKVDVYAKSTASKPEISIFHFRTAENIERVRMSVKRRSLKKPSVDSALTDDIKEMQLSIVLNLNKDFLTNRRLSIRKESFKNSVNSHNLFTVESKENQEEEVSADSSDLSRLEEEMELLSLPPD